MLNAQFSDYVLLHRMAWSPEVEHDLVGNRISQTARVRQAIGGAFAGLSGGH